MSTPTVKRSRLLESQPSTSKSSSSNSSEGFTPGSIVRIRLKNFLTYDDVECFPGPKLNLILGPNGSGKSTLVCAICLGLGGKTSVLGRASSICDFIKHGANDGSVEIELYQTPKNVIIKRNIFENTTKTTWMVNGKETNQKNVDELMAKMNIQIGNLCQFLPQDKVADFAKMSPQEMLVNTEKAIGSVEMYQSHMELKEIRGKLTELKSTLQKEETHLEKEKQINNRLHEQVKSFEVYQRNVEKIRLLKQKKPWLEYEQIRQIYNNMKTKHEAIVQDYNRLQEQYKPMQKDIKHLQDVMKGSQNEIRTVTYNIQKANNSISNQKKAVESHLDKVTELQGDLDVKKLGETERRRRLNGLKQQLESLQNELATLDENQNTESVLQTQIDEVTKAITEADHKSFQLQQQEENCHVEKNRIKTNISELEHELRKIQDMRDTRLGILQRKDRDAYEAALWLQENRDKFRKTIYDPIMLLIEVVDPKMAKYIENHIAMRDLVMFVCEDPRDMNEFLRSIRDERKLQVNAAMVPSTQLNSFQPSIPLEKIRMYGFHHYLKDLITAPDAVMRFLCQNYALHIVPVGNSQTKDMVQDIFKNTRLTSFYTENNKYSCKRSKYSGNISTSNFHLNPVSIFTTFSNVDRKEYLKKAIADLKQEYEQLDGKLQNIRKEQNTLKDQVNELRSKKRDLVFNRDRKRTLVARINQKEESIRLCEQGAVDLKAEETKTSMKILRIIAARVVDVRSYMDAVRKSIGEYRNRTEITIRNASQLTRLNKMEEQYRTASVELRNKEREVQEYENKLRTVKVDAKKLLRSAQEISNLQSSSELPESEFNDLPNDLHELDAMLHELQAKSYCMLETDGNVLKEFKKREVVISDLDKVTEEQRSKVETFQEKVDVLKNNWLPVIENLMSKINDNFSKFFSLLGCAGEVSLNKGEDEENYDKYGISIKVKFRDTEQLKELSPFQQSGGERSVATVLYMMALQELTRVPFRCVDEINQGMDSTNERRVFELMLDISTRENTSQYFLLTPKLLRNLSYSDGITVLNVFNGCMVPSKDWNMKKFIRRRERLNAKDD